MCYPRQQAPYTTLVSAGFDNQQQNGTYEAGFRRWLVRKIEEDRMRVAEAAERFHFNPENGRTLTYQWRQKYAPEMVLSLRVIEMCQFFLAGWYSYP